MWSRLFHGILIADKEEVPILISTGLMRKSMRMARFIGRKLPEIKSKGDNGVYVATHGR